MTMTSTAVKERQTRRRLEVLERAGGRCVDCGHSEDLILVEVGGPFPGRMTMSPSHIAITDNPEEFDALLAAVLPFRDLLCRPCGASRYNQHKAAARRDAARQQLDAAPA